MLDFIPAKSLKSFFEVFGHFYSIQLNTGRRIDCRSVLEIVARNKVPTDVDLLSTQCPDAIFIMMNPGSSKPLEVVDNLVPQDRIGHLEVSLVPTKPDITQYQVMRVMHHCGWRHVRVLNLSDVREPKSSEFFKRCREIKAETGFTAHSIFSKPRAQELSLYLTLAKAQETPFVCAWGVNDHLNLLIEECLKKVPQFGRIGLLKSETKDKYFHPLPTLQSDKVMWVEKLVAEIGAK